MNSFDKVYKNSESKAINEQQKAAADDRVRLIAALKHEYGISDFNKISENEKASFKASINEMWNAETGLSEKGIAFINEGKAPLTEKSTDEQIEKYVKREVKADIDNIITCLLAKGECGSLIDIKKNIEESTGKKVKAKDMKTWVHFVCSKHLADQIRSIKF